MWLHPLVDPVLHTDWLLWTEASSEEINSTVFMGQTNYTCSCTFKTELCWKVLHGAYDHGLKQCPHSNTPSHLKYVDEDILLWLLSAANIFQDNGVVDALGVRLVQVICVWLVPLLEGKEDLVLFRTHYLNILGGGGGKRRQNEWIEEMYAYYNKTKETIERAQRDH